MWYESTFQCVSFLEIIGACWKRWKEILKSKGTNKLGGQRGIEKMKNRKIDKKSRYMEESKKLSKEEKSNRKRRKIQIRLELKRKSVETKKAGKGEGKK